MEVTDVLLEKLVEFRNDPEGFVLFCFPWGEPGPLKDEWGPDEWQTKFLRCLKEEIDKRKDGDITTAIQMAVASGHGVGKTAMVAWLILWFISTRPTPQIVVTANTQPQLSTKTWRELAKWWKMAINQEMFQWTATKFYCKADPETWFAAAIPWTEHNSESFAGTHEDHVLFIFDEASSIASQIWDVAQGGLTTEGSMWFTFGNPTQTTGSFADCFGKKRHRWRTFHVDSREAKKANPQQIQQWLEDYGEDSDFFRVRVRGQFPRASSSQFISNEWVDTCQAYTAEDYEEMPIILGVDVARYGDDQTVITAKQGLKVWPQEKHRQLSVMEVADEVAGAIDRFDAHLCFIDEGGVGAGAVDRLRQLGYAHKVIGINSSSKPDDKELYFNKRAEMWGRMREFLQHTCDLPTDPELAGDLVSVEYGFTNKQQIQLEKKEDMKRRGLESPDCADSLALCFAENIVIGAIKSKQRIRRRNRKNLWRVV